MNLTVKGFPRSGEVSIPSSKSQMHRLLICAALGKNECVVSFDGLSKDISATASCLNALGADIEKLSETLFRVSPIRKVPQELCHLYCGESGSTLRFLLPIVGALGADAVFHMEGRLPERPLEPFDKELIKGSMTLRREGEKLYCSGKLNSGEYTLPGNVSSQYISGLLFALPMLNGDSRLNVTGSLESSAYIKMTEDTLGQSGIELNKDSNSYDIKGAQSYCLPPECRAEGDFSNAAFFLCMGALSDEGVTVKGLNMASSQGDKAVLDILREYGAELTVNADSVTVKRGKLRGITIDASPIPDLIPVLSVVAALCEGETKIINAGRLRIKESDRLSATAALLSTLGADLTEQPEGLVIRGVKRLHGGTVSAFGDHRIAMSAAVAACACSGEVTVTGSESVSKSYPCFWEDFSNLKGAEI